MQACSTFNVLNLWPLSWQVTIKNLGDKFEIIFPQNSPMAFSTKQNACAIHLITINGDIDVTDLSLNWCLCLHVALKREFIAYCKLASEIERMHGQQYWNKDHEFHFLSVCSMRYKILKSATYDLLLFIQGTHSETARSPLYLLSCLGVWSSKLLVIKLLFLQECLSSTPWIRCSQNRAISNVGSNQIHKAITKV